MLSAYAGGQTPSGKRPGEKKLIVSPLTQTRKGGCRMTLTEIIALLGLIGGAAYMTFQISWAIFKEIHDNKK